MNRNEYFYYYDTAFTNLIFAKELYSNIFFNKEKYSYLLEITIYKELVEAIKNVLASYLEYLEKELDLEFKELDYLINLANKYNINLKHFELVLKSKDTLNKHYNKYIQIVERKKNKQNIENFENEIEYFDEHSKELQVVIFNIETFILENYKIKTLEYVYKYL